MVVVNVTAGNCQPQTIVIGRRGTYDTMQIAFDLSNLIEAYGNGVAVLAVKRSQDESAYPAVVTQEDNTLTWTVSETDTAYVGAGECQLMWYVDGGLAKTIIYPMVVMRDILATSEDAPDAYQTWVDDLTALGAETLQNAQDAAQSASDAETAKDDAVTAKEAAEEAADRAEEAAESFTHPTASAETLAPDAPATASYNDGHFTFGIPKGPKGDKMTYVDLTEEDKRDLIQGPIAEAQADAEQAVEDKGQEIIDSLPEDYMELLDDFDDFKDDLVLVQDTQPTEPDNKIWIAESTVNEYTIPTYDEFSTVKSALEQDGTIAPQNASINTSGEIVPNNTRVLFGFKTYGKVLKITVKPGYTVICYKDGVYDATEINVSATSTTGTVYRFFYAYPSKQFAFVIRKQTPTDAITIDEAYANVTIEEAPHNISEVAPGLYRESVELLPNTLFGLEKKYYYNSDRAASAPIKIPKGGLRITYNKSQGVAFRVICVSMTSDGFTANTEDADLVAESGTTMSSLEPVYIPYIDDAYVVIVTGSYSSDVANITDAIHVYTGKCNIGEKLLGLFPVSVRMSNSKPIIEFGTKERIQSTSCYYGGYLWLKYAKKITANPKYSIVANIYELNSDGTTTLKESFYAVDSSSFGGGRISGVQQIDLTQYDFNGYVQFAIQCPVQYRARGAEVLSYKLPITMGVMHDYIDVCNNVAVDYNNYFVPSVEPGLPSRIFDNVNKFMEYTYPLRKALTYVFEHETGAEGHVCLASENATPALYAGANYANTVLHAVTGKSYYTGMANINSRCYQFARDDSSKGRIGYGLTCVPFVSVIAGLLETYYPTTLAFGSPSKFTQVSSDWDYQYDMDELKPGDILVEYREMPDGAEIPTEYTYQHVMIVYEKKYVNGQLETITLAEAGYPYTRFTAIYNEKYYPVMTNFPSFRRLADYHYISRLKPEYINKIDEVFDLSKDYTPGTVMCDRGTNSIYCVNPVNSADASQGMELEQPELILTIADDTATSISIYKDGDSVATVTIGNTTKNGQRVVDIRSYITEQGLYTIKTNTSNDVQETFWVQAPETISFEVTSTERTIHVSNLDNIQFLDVWYKHIVDDTGGVEKSTFWHKIYLASDFTADESPYDTTGGKLAFPSTLDGNPYSRVRVIYKKATEDGEFGLYQSYFQAYPEAKGGTTIPIASSEYSYGA